MNKTSAILSVAALTLLSSTAALAMGTNTYVGAQLGLTGQAGDNFNGENNFNLYGAMVGTTIRDNFSADLNFVNQGEYFHGMADVYFNHALSSNVTSRIGGGIGAIYFKSQDLANQDSETKFAYQGAVELEYSVNDTLGFFSGYHYVSYSSDNDNGDYANEYLFGMHYYL
ncbi:MAG: hypothetical protein CMF55_04760 [Legionellales bacterium]|nr:hypothetical protein [Legionellales bacterium]